MAPYGRRSLPTPDPDALQFVYDYRFAKEEDDKKIPCLCNAPTCKKFLN